MWHDITGKHPVLQTSKWRSWTSVLQVRHLSSSWAPQLQMPRLNFYCPHWRKRKHRWMRLRRNWKLPKRDARYCQKLQTDMWNFINWFSLAHWMRIQVLWTSCQSSLLSFLPEPGSWNTETLGWTKRAWEGGCAESHGGKMQLYQGDKGETRSEDGGEQREPHCTDGSSHWEIQGEGKLLIWCQLSLKPNVDKMKTTVLWFFCFSTLIGQEARRSEEEQGGDERKQELIS